MHVCVFGGWGDLVHDNNYHFQRLEFKVLLRYENGCDWKGCVYDFLRGHEKDKIEQRMRRGKEGVFS